MTEPSGPVSAEDAWLPEPGSPWQRLHPRSIAVRPLGLIKAGGFPALIGVGGAASQMGWFALLLLPVLLAGVVLIGLLTYLATSFIVADGQIRVRRGLLNRTTLTANLDKVRSVDLEAPLLHRIVGLSRVEIGTGVDNTRIELDSLGKQQAQELRRFLLQRTSQAPAPSDETEAEIVTDRGEAEELSRLHPGWAWYAPLKLSGLAVVAGGLGALSQVVDEDAVAYLDWADSAWQWVTGQALPLVVLLGVGLAVAAWVVLSVAAYLIHWWQLRLVQTSDTLRLTAGLFTTRSTSIELIRIRGLRMTQAPLIRWADGGDLASYATGVEQGVTSVLPTAPVGEVQRVGTALLADPDPLAVALLEHGPAARARLRFRGVAVTALVTALVTVVVLAAAVEPPGSRPGLPVIIGLSLAIIAVVAVLAWAAVRWTYRHLGHALTERHLVAGSGTFTCVREVLETDGIIGWVVRQSFFQRRRGLATLIATTAAGPERVAIEDVPLPRAVAFADAATPGMLTDFLPPPTDDEPVNLPARP